MGKCLLATGIAKAQVASLQPVQVGVGTQGAAGAVALATSTLVRAYQSSADWVVLKVDLRNAFNCAERQAMLKTCASRTPALYNYLSFCYSEAVPCLLGDTVIECTRGSQQGCPLGPVGFALTVQPHLEEVAAHHGLTWSSWYLDDGTLFGTASAVTSAFHDICQRMQEVGLTVNLGKCEVWGPAGEVFTREFPEVLHTPWGKSQVSPS